MKIELARKMREENSSMMLDDDSDRDDFYTTKSALLTAVGAVSESNPYASAVTDSLRREKYVLRERGRQRDVRKRDLPWGSCDGNDPFQIRFTRTLNPFCRISSLMLRFEIDPGKAQSDLANAISLREVELNGVNHASARGRKQAGQLEREIRTLTALKSLRNTSVSTSLKGLTFKNILLRNGDFFCRHERDERAALESYFPNAERRCGAYFFVNRVAVKQGSKRWETHQVDNVGKDRLYEKVVDTLRFIYVDIDEPISECRLREKLARLPHPPDVIVQSSKDRWHIYWSISPVKVPVTMRINAETGEQEVEQGSNLLLLYEGINRAMLNHLGGDPDACDALRILRIPGTKNYKPDKGRRPGLCRYARGSRQLPEAKASPRYTLEQMELMALEVSGRLGIPLDRVGENELTKKKKKVQAIGSPERASSGDEVDVTEQRPFDYEAGWEKGLAALQDAYGVTETLSENQVAFFRYIFKNRYREEISFTDQFRMSLSGSGQRRRELQEAREWFGCLGRRLSRLGRGKGVPELIVRSQGARYKGKVSERRKERWKVHMHLSQILGVVRGKFKKQAAVELVQSSLYPSGSRYVDSYLDACLLRRAEITGEAAVKLIKDKIHRSANRTDGEPPCSADVLNVERAVETADANFDATKMRWTCK